MSSDQRAARIVGWLFIGTFVFSIPALLLYGPVLHHHGTYVLGGGHDAQIALGAFLEILLVICGIGTALALFPVVKRQNEGLALGYVAIRIVESTIIVAGIVSVMAVVTLRHDLAGTGADAGTLTIAARSLVAVKDWTFLLGPGFCSGLGNGLILGYLMYRSGLVPRRFAQFAMFAGACAFIAATGALFDVYYNKQSTPQAILTIPEIIWEASFGIYLVVKGFKSRQSFAATPKPRSPHHRLPRCGSAGEANGGVAPAWGRFSLSFRWLAPSTSRPPRPRASLRVGLWEDLEGAR